MSVVDRSFDHPLKLEERASMPLAGGIMLHGYQCGMIWGAALAAGAQAYRLYGPGPQAETAAIIAAVVSRTSGRFAAAHRVVGAPAKRGWLGTSAASLQNRCDWGLAALIPSHPASA